MNATLLTGKSTCKYYICCKCERSYESELLWCCQTWGADAGGISLKIPVNTGSVLQLTAVFSAQLSAVFNKVCYQNQIPPVFLHWTHLFILTLNVTCNLWSEVKPSETNLHKILKWKPCTDINFLSTKHIHIIVAVWKDCQWQINRMFCKIWKSFPEFCDFRFSCKRKTYNSLIFCCFLVHTDVFLNFIF
jgi:hypothetical protein